MPDIGENLIAYLKGKTPITDLIGAGVGARIYQNLAKQSVPTPFIVIEEYPGESFECLNLAANMSSTRFQIDCYGATADEAFELADNVKLAPLQMYRGPMGVMFATNVSSDASYRKGYDPAIPGGNQKRYWVSRDYLVTYYDEIVIPPPTQGAFSVAYGAGFDQ